MFEVICSGCKTYVELTDATLEEYDHCKPSSKGSPAIVVVTDSDDYYGEWVTIACECGNSISSQPYGLRVANA